MMLDRDGLINRRGAGVGAMSPPDLGSRSPSTLASNRFGWSQPTLGRASSGQPVHPLGDPMQSARLAPILYRHRRRSHSPPQLQPSSAGSRRSSRSRGRRPSAGRRSNSGYGRRAWCLRRRGNQLITGLKAGEAEREKAAHSDDNSYGRYQKAERAYTDAQAKCEADRQAWAMKGNAKEADKPNALIEKSLKARKSGTTRPPDFFQDSVSVLQGGPCRLSGEAAGAANGLIRSEREIRCAGAEGRTVARGAGLGAGEFAMAQGAHHGHSAFRGAQRRIRNPRRRQ